MYENNLNLHFDNDLLKYEFESTILPLLESDIVKISIDVNILNQIYLDDILKILLVPSLLSSIDNKHSKRSISELYIGIQQNIHLLVLAPNNLSEITTINKKSAIELTKFFTEFSLRVSIIESKLILFRLLVDSVNFLISLSGKSGDIKDLHDYLILIFSQVDFYITHDSDLKIIFETLEKLNENWKEKQDLLIKYHRDRKIGLEESNEIFKLIDRLKKAYLPKIVTPKDYPFSSLNYERRLGLISSIVDQIYITNSYGIIFDDYLLIKTFSENLLDIKIEKDNEFKIFKEIIPNYVKKPLRKFDESKLTDFLHTITIANNLAYYLVSIDNQLEELKILGVSILAFTKRINDTLNMKLKNVHELHIEFRTILNNVLRDNNILINLKVLEGEISSLYDENCQRNANFQRDKIVQNKMYTVKCENCYSTQGVSFIYKGIIFSEERKMGLESVHEWELDEECENINCLIHIYGTINIIEYPTNAFSNEDLKIYNAKIESIRFPKQKKGVLKNLSEFL